MAELGRQVCVLMVEDRLDERARLTAELAATDENIELRFASSGHEAMAALEFRGGVDVLVTHASESRSEGLHLLTEARLKMPHITRLLVAVDADLETAGSGLRLAHEVLRSPLSAASLAAFVRRHDEINRHDEAAITRLIGSVDVLPSPPDYVVMLNEAANSMDISIGSIAHVLENDVAATAKLLSLVNSAFFGLHNPVKSVHQAITYLGIDTTRNLLGAVELVRSLSSVPEDLRSYVQQIHDHSMAVAQLARRIADRTPYAHDAFAAGMLHDVGVLVLLAHAPEKFRAMCANPFAEAEILETTHARIGSALLSMWGLPWPLIEATAQSHRADSAIDPMPSTAHAVFVAEQLAGMVTRHPVPWETSRMPADSYLQQVKASDIAEELISSQVAL